jgi:hypothetical protein
MILDENRSMLKETLLREIESLPKVHLETLLDFVQFLKFRENQKAQGIGAAQRVPGLDAGTTWVSDDFDEPLPDSFWFESDINGVTHETCS